MSKEENKQDQGVYQRRDETQKRKNDTAFEPACGAGYLLDREPSVFIASETGIFGKRMSCITAASDGKYTGFGGEGVNGISSLPHEAKGALNRIGAANRAVPDRRKSIQGQQMLFIFAQTAESGHG